MTEAGIVKFDSVTYSAGGNAVLRELSFQVRRGEVLVLLGESGCGKTTTLRLINRLIIPDSGVLTVLGRDAADWDTVELRRRIGYVIQDGGLFPHMSVARNVGLPLELAGADQAAISRRAAECLEVVRLDPANFSGRFPHELSGGQRQRVGVARSLVHDPELLLLDEPFGALDAVTRSALQSEFARIVKELNKTAVFVTHDISEAMRLANRIALMERGQIVFLGTPDEFRRSDIPLANQHLAAFAD